VIFSVLSIAPFYPIDISVTR